MVRLEPLLSNAHALAPRAGGYDLARLVGLPDLVEDFGALHGRLAHGGVQEKPEDEAEEWRGHEDR